MKNRVVAIAGFIVAFISIAFMNCGDDDGITGPTPGRGPAPKKGYAALMPLNVGNKWVYEHIYSDEEGPKSSDEYELLVVDKFDNYHGFESYLVKCKWLYRIPTFNYITLGCDGDKCYLYTCPWWEYLIEDDMEGLAWSQTGLFTPYRLEFNLVKDVSVPAGNFKDCKQLALIHEGYTYEECYAKDVGLVYHRHRYEYSATDWYQYEYKLKSYEVTPPE